MLSPYNPETNTHELPAKNLELKRVEADDFDFLGYDEQYDLYDLEDEIEAVEPIDDLEEVKSFLSQEIKMNEIDVKDIIVNNDHEKIQEAESLMEIMYANDLNEN